MHTEQKQAWRNRTFSCIQLLQIASKRIAGGMTGGFNCLLTFVACIVKAGGTPILHKNMTFTVMALLAVLAVATGMVIDSTIRKEMREIPVTTDPVITALLQGEQLAPPAPLPPELFLTQEIIRTTRQELGNANREWSSLDSDFRQRLLRIYQLMAQHGYQMALLEGYRSPERQALLAGLGTPVTNAGAYQSYHQYGLAADSAFLEHGKIVISEKDPRILEGYRLFGEYAESIGLVWGGRWKLKDFGHVELRKSPLLNRRQ